MWVSGGPGPLLPFSPITWQARQPDWPTTSSPARKVGFWAALRRRRRRHVDRVRRAGVGAGVGQEGHREDRRQTGGQGHRAALDPPLRAAVVERQQEQQDHADRRHADRGHRRELRHVLHHPQDLEQEEEVPVRARDVGGGGRVGLGPELGAEHERQEDDHQHHDDRHDRVLGDRVGEERLALVLQDRVLAEVLLLLGLVHAAAQTSASRSSGSSSALIHGGAEMPSLVIRYRWAPIRAAISPGISIMWIA